MCTLERRGDLFLLTLTGDTKKDQEHRLSPQLISSIRSALAEVKSQAVNGSALVTLAQGRFFSNGFDLRHAQAVGVKSGSSQAAVAELLRMVDLFKGVVADLLSLPMPTIAAVNGHAAAAGLILAMGHDYVMMTLSRGVMYMSELDIGMTLPDYFTALIRAKVGSAGARRELVLLAAKVGRRGQWRWGSWTRRTAAWRRWWMLRCVWRRSWGRGGGAEKRMPRLGSLCTRRFVGCWG
ncbi:UNVERIFIED_CONTAM: Enoyl-CoA delta isomerase 2, peroxisomal [Sesamum angustifolium]|uniref:Delta(3)-Delta(2)-enoyl-CoA isomerase n=1 Tax=Sesamum angustifolium TaxID=2727405 RepID=A0AAW2LVJ9_9LAMI